MAFDLSNILQPFTGDAIRSASNVAAGDINTGIAQLGANYAAGRGAISDYYTRALQPFTALQPAATAGYNLYADVTGAGGTAGQDRARALFQTDPGYQFARDQALDAIARTGVARGTATGNSMVDAARYAAGYGAQQYGDWVSRLAPWLNQGTGIASALGNINVGAGNAINANYIGQGNALGGLYGRLGDVQAQGEMAPFIAGTNLLNTGLAVGNMIAGSPGIRSAISSGANALGGGLFNLARGQTPGSPLIGV
jgi:hypothetical protein